MSWASASPQWVPRRSSDTPRTSTIVEWYLVAAPTWSKPSEPWRRALRYVRGSTAS